MTNGAHFSTAKYLKIVRIQNGDQLGSRNSLFVFVLSHFCLPRRSNPGPELKDRISLLLPRTTPEQSCLTGGTTALEWPRTNPEGSRESDLGSRESMAIIIRVHSDLRYKSVTLPPAFCMVPCFLYENPAPCILYEASSAVSLWCGVRFSLQNLNRDPTLR